MEVKFTCKECSEELHENPSSVLKEEQQFNGQKIEVMYYIYYTMVPMQFLSFLYDI